MVTADGGKGNKVKRNPIYKQCGLCSHMVEHWGLEDDHEDAFCVYYCDNTAETGCEAEKEKKKDEKKKELP